MKHTQTKCKILYIGELKEANRRAIQAGRNAIEPDYLERLPNDMRYPVMFTLPWEERPGWVRCLIGTAVSLKAEDYVPLLLDVPRWMYDNLSEIDIPSNEEQT